jgi:pimeloyl-ACP methyl ester carboxylesterase
VPRRAPLFIVIALYVLALLASRVVQHRGSFQGLSPPRTGEAFLQLTLPLEQGLAVGVQRWRAIGARRGVVLLMHGSPGAGADFGRLASRLASDGFDVYAPDMPGFGASQALRGDHSVRANATVMLALLDALEVSSAHVVGWSNGGGTALHMADLAPDRLASLTLMASIGDQRFEGSGSHAIEHLKYRVGFLLAGVLPEAVPHFGLLGTYDRRVAWLRNFDHTDQRELGPLMDRLRAHADAPPTLILHGDRDVLVPIASARDAHARMARGHLVVLDANHFLPIMQADDSARALLDHFARAHAGDRSRDGVIDDRGEERPGLRGAIDRARVDARGLPWLVQALIIAVIVAWRPRLGLFVAAGLVAGPGVDLFVAFLGVCAGAMLRGMVLALRAPGLAPPRARDLGVSGVDWRRRLALRPGRSGAQAGLLFAWRDVAWRGVGSAALAGSPRAGAWSVATFVAWCGLATLVACAMSLVVALIAWLVGEYLAWPVVERTLARGVGLGSGVGLIVGAGLGAAGAWAGAWLALRAPGALTIRGWRWARIWFERFAFEYWPAWAVYVPIAPWLAGFALKYGGVREVTACNPGIANAGGWVGESKAEIMRALGPSPFALATIPIDAGPDASARADAALRLARQHEIAMPFVLKPDAGQRGFAFKLCRDESQVRAYFESVRARVVLQPYAPGPHEAGILWVRWPEAERPAGAGTTGFIYSVTRKRFATITGDGVRTLEALIERHPRYRRQHRTFLARFADDASRVIGMGEELRLAVSGNHCQGTMFVDGEDLITPELTRVIDGLSVGFGRDEGKTDSLDYARYDVRYESDEALRRGEGFHIVELNGTSSESTNMYDPGKGLLWSWRVLLGQWRLLGALGQQRVRAGGRRCSWREISGMIRQHFRERSGSEVAD